MVFPPSSLIFGAVTYLISAAKGVSASYDAIQDLMVTLKVYHRPYPFSELQNRDNILNSIGLYDTTQSVRPGSNL